MKRIRPEMSDMWARHTAEWRDTAQIASQWRDAAEIDPRLLESRATGAWWDLLDELRITLIVSREYEHLAIAASSSRGRLHYSFFPVPHPSGLAVDRERRSIVLASTRNPNQVFTFKPIDAMLDRLDVAASLPDGFPLVPVSSAYYPGSLYLHDMAIIGGVLYANAAGHNCVVRLEPESHFDRVWWPRCIEVNRKPVFGQNHIQLNSIAAGESIEDSFFSASSTGIGRLRPGHRNYPVDGLGVIFSGHTREPVCTGLTRPHSARLWQQRVWVANSGYGELGCIHDGRFEVFARLPGWTRGLCIVDQVAFIATSRVIPEYTRYAPGLDSAASRCAVHAICLKTGRVLGKLEWPFGNQVFAVDWISNRWTHGFSFNAGTRRRQRELALFYSYLINRVNHD